MKALGFVEVKGYVPAYAAADAMLKAADTQVIKKVWVGAALVTVIIEGEIGAVRTAVDAGCIAAKQFEGLVGAYTIAKPSKELIEIL